MVKLSGLKHLCKDDEVLVVLTPASKIEDVPLKGRLHHEKIVQTSLVSSIDPQTFELPIEKLVSALLKPKAIRGRRRTTRGLSINAMTRSISPARSR